MRKTMEETMNDRAVMEKPMMDRPVMSPSMMDRRPMPEDSHSRRPLIIGLIAAAVIGVLWYAFRPELLFVNKNVNESFPAAAATGQPDAAPMSLSSGMFHTVAHDTKGTATIHQLADGGRVLRLTDFETSNGPDVRVLLVATNDATDSETVKQAGHIELGKLKGNIGEQNYDVPQDVDLNKYRAVTIWCNRFGVNFGTAPLSDN